ncbi:MAG: radical SAM/SPASM domain-containing protein [Promethearchaeota archaeon]
MDKKRLARLIIKYIYRQPIWADKPKNRWFFALSYGNLKKFRNFQRMRNAYRRKQVRVQSYPYEIRTEVSSACNLHCPLCPSGTGDVDRPPGFMTLDTFNKVLAEFGDYVFRIRMDIWGEPLMNKDLWRFVALSEEKGVGTEISTNLSIEMSDAQIDRLIQAGLGWVIVSNDAASRASYDKYRLGGDFDLVIYNMRRIIERRKKLRFVTPFVEWQFIPFRHNEHEIEAAYQMAQDIGVDGFRFKPARLDKTGGLRLSDVIPKRLLDKWKPKTTQWHNLTENVKDSLHAFLCPFLWGTMTIHWDGTVSPCCETYKTKDDLGDFLKERFRDLWDGPAFVNSRREALGLECIEEDNSTACRDCKVFKKPYSKVK